jgi:hypothetical protein
MNVETEMSVESCAGADTSIGTFANRRLTEFAAEQLGELERLMEEDTRRASAETYGPAKRRSSCQRSSWIL